MGVFSLGDCIGILPVRSVVPGRDDRWSLACAPRTRKVRFEAEFLMTTNRAARLEREIRKVADWVGVKAEDEVRARWSWPRVLKLAFGDHIGGPFFVVACIGTSSGPNSASPVLVKSFGQSPGLAAVE